MSSLNDKELLQDLKEEYLYLRDSIDYPLNTDDLEQVKGDVQSTIISMIRELDGIKSIKHSYKKCRLKSKLQDLYLELEF